MSQETSDQVVTGGNDVYVIPINRDTLRLYRAVQFCIASLNLVIPLFMPVIFIISVINGPDQITFGRVLSAAIGYVLCYPLALVVIYFLFPKWLIQWQVEALQYRIEGRTLRVDSGVFFFKRKGIPLDRITDFALVQGPVMRMLGIWALQVQTASVGTPTPEVTLIAIENPKTVRDELLRRRDVAAQGNRRDYC